MEAKPMKNVGKVFLGMTMEEVVIAIGEPDNKAKALWSEDTKDQSWEYKNLGFELSFYEDYNFLCGSIDVYSRAVMLEGIKPIGVSEENFLDMFPDVVMTDDFEGSGRCYDYSKKEIMFWVSDGVVDNFTLFPRYDETGEKPIWPKRD